MIFIIGNNRDSSCSPYSIMDASFVSRMWSVRIQGMDISMGNWILRPIVSSRKNSLNQSWERSQHCCKVSAKQGEDKAGFFIRAVCCSNKASGSHLSFFSYRWSSADECKRRTRGETSQCPWWWGLPDCCAESSWNRFCPRSETPAWSSPCRAAYQRKVAEQENIVEWNLCKCSLISVGTLLVSRATSPSDTTHLSRCANSDLITCVRLVEELFFSLWCLIHGTVWYLIKKKVYEKSPLDYFLVFYTTASVWRLQCISPLVITLNMLNAAEPHSSPSFTNQNTRVQICCCRLDKHRRWQFSWALLRRAAPGKQISSWNWALSC